jgi:hypothetical protein
MPDFPHKHICEPCGLVWEHDPGTGLGSMRAEDYRPPSRGVSHTCPGCGEPRVVIYFGGKPVNVSHIFADISIQVRRNAAAWGEEFERSGQTVGHGVR